MSRYHKAALLACTSMLVGCHPWGEPGISEIDVGVDVRVNAIISVPRRGLGLFAAVSGGLVVDQDGQRWELSSHELRALATDQHGRYWVCGDQGYLAFTDIDESGAVPDWTPVASGSEANFYGLAATRERVVVVGDDILLVGVGVGVEGDGEWQWTEPAPPSGGWGRLRAASQVSEGDTWAFLAVGLDGRALLSSADANTWTAFDDLDAGADFKHMCGTLALGDELTHARWTPSGWVSWGGDAGANYVGCGGAYVVSSDRWISKLNSRGIDHLYQLPWQPRAFDPRGVYVAGDAGHVAFWNPAEVGEF